MLVANLVAECLVAGEFPNVFPGIRPSALDCEEPIVVLEGAFERESRTDGEERGTAAVDVLAVREVCADGEAAAIALEGYLRGCDWEPFADAEPWRVVGLDTSAPWLAEHDSSGRFVWKFTVTLTVVRSV